jgi:hypothetical protein
LGYNRPITVIASEKETVLYSKVRTMKEEEEELARDILARLPQELKEELAEAARVDGSTVEEYLLVLLHDIEQQGLFKTPLNEDISEEDFLREIFVGDCPACSSESTVCCDEIEEIDDPTVGMCETCGFIWCLECGFEVRRGEDCGHWEVCGDCDEEKDEFEDCGIPPAECPKVVDWMGRALARACEGTCAWCGKDVPDECELFGVGAKLRGGMEFTSNPSESGFFMPVSIAGKMVPAVVTGADSDARREGNELMFMTCSEACAQALREALLAEKEVIDRAELN